MSLRTLLQATWITLALGAVSALVGCAPASDDDIDTQVGAAKESTNGLTLINGLTLTNGLSMTNGLVNTNGLVMTNGLTSTNGLLSTNGLMTTDGGRSTVAYLVKCALGASDSIVKKDQYGTSYTFHGSVGLCPSWKDSGIATNQTCQEMISACMLAHVKTS